MNKEGLYYPDGRFVSRKEIMDKVITVFQAENSGEPVDYHKAIMDILDYKHPSNPQEIADKLSVGMDVVHNVINDLVSDGFGLVKSERGYLKTKNVSPELSLTDDSWLGKQFKIGIVSDTHLGSKKERLDALESMYDLFEKEGVRAVYHAGDISEGWGVYRGQEFEVSIPGQDEQIDYVVANYPQRKGIVTKFICGNHDLRMYERGGIDPGRPIAKQRKDLVYLGPMQAKVNWTDGVTLELLHPAGGGSYALSYKMQKNINARSAGERPNALVFGHYHTSFYMLYQDVHCIQAPAFKDPGIWEKSLGLNSNVGGWIVEGGINDGRINRFKPELITFGSSVLNQVARMDL